MYSTVPTLIAQPGIMPPQPSTVVAPHPTTVIPSIPTQRSPWRIKFPQCISTVFATIQFITAIAIIGCETGAMLVEILTATIYGGIWGGIFFLVTSVSQWMSSCCFRERSCANFTLVMQCFSWILSACLVAFNTYVIIYPATCFFSFERCNSTGLTRGWYYTTYNYDTYKVPLIKAQLGANCLMLVLCSIYITIYIVTSARVYRYKHPRAIYPQQVYSQPQHNPIQYSSVQYQQPQQLATSYIAPQPQQIVQSYAAPVVPQPQQVLQPYAAPMAPQPLPTPYTSTIPNHLPPIHHTPTALTNDARSTEIACPSCHTSMHMTAQKR